MPAWTESIRSPARTVCIGCGATEIKCVGAIPPVIVFAGQILGSPLLGGELLTCQHCHLSFRYPRPEKSFLDDLYRQGKLDNWQTEQSSRSDWRIASDWIELNLNPGGKILDVGCFDGGFLRTIDSRHIRCGIEIHELAGKKATEHGVQLIGSDFADIGQESTLFDVVTAFDVIEHTDNPVEFLEKISKITKDGGLIIVSTGNTDAFSWRLLGSRYWYCTIGEHISFINPQWCERVALQLNLELNKVVQFSHQDASRSQKTGDFFKNLFFAIFPFGFQLLRRLGLGGPEFRLHKIMLGQPPSWMSAKDHFVCIFTKKCIKT